MSAERGFTSLDEQAAALGTGYTLVHDPASLLGPVARHLARRSEAAGRRAVCIDGAEIDEPWRELCRRLRLSPSDDPTACARALLARVGHGVAVVSAPAPTLWGATVADELARLIGARRFDGWIVELSEGRRSPYATPLSVGAEVTSSELERWWQALWHAERVEGRLAPLDRLDEAEQWWRNVRAAADARQPTLSAEAESLLGRLAACRQSVPPALQRALGSARALDELRAHQLVTVHEDGSACVRVTAAGLSPADALAAAEGLRRSSDPWDRMRAAELRLAGGEPDSAAELAEGVLEAVTDACGRADLWGRWERALATLSGGAAARWARHFSELALRLGDVDPAFVLARHAMAQAGARRGYELLLCVGRATAARGEHGAAAVVLEQAIECAPGSASRAQALVELAEVCCAEGDTERATALARRALGEATDFATRLGARSVLGKLLLGAGLWQEAERHFATDAHEAAGAGEVEAELRAQLNHATALVMGGRLGEAAAGFQTVLDQAVRGGVVRATAFALSNLAVLASRRHDYAEALRLREQAIRAFRRIGNRKWLARSTTYLADLRVDLGLLDEAGQALAFARHVLGGPLRPTEATWMGYVASRIHLGRGELAKAAAAVVDALGSAPRSADGTMVGECHCQAARVALAELDVRRAAHHIGEARRSVKVPASSAELALLDATLARIEGRAFGAVAHLALELAQGAGDRRRMAEAHRLLHHAAARDGDALRAGRELELAAELEQAVASTLPGELGARCRAFMVRSDAPPSAAVAVAPDSEGRLRTARPELVGSHPCMAQLRRVIDKVAPTDTTVLVCGESGTGKELVADALHRHSRRRAGPLLKVNCAALVESLLLTELFGHEKGAYTGATSQRRGCFEMAAGGTIFLDEIGDVSTGTQAALLRVLQERTFQRVGGTELLQADVRIVCATHQDLTAMVAQGRFREDLYYRLRAVVLDVPPLRQRLSDLPLLCAELLPRIAREQHGPVKRLSADALGLLAQHGWPGNVRELENALRVSALFAEGDVLFGHDLRRHVDCLRELPGDAPAPPALQPSAAAAARVEDVAYAAVRDGTGLRDIQKRLELHCIARALAETHGHVGRAAALLGIKRPRLSQLIKEYGLKCPPEEP